MTTSQLLLGIASLLNDVVLHELERGGAIDWHRVEKLSDATDAVIAAAFDGDE